jgi:MFS family permease
MAAASVVGIAALLGELRDELKVGDVAAGLLIGLGFVASFVAQVTLAPLADRGHGPRLIRGGVALSCIALVGMAVFDSYAGFVVSRGALGFGVGMMIPGIRRVAVVLDPSRVGENLGKLIAGEVIGFLLGPVVAVGLAEVGGVSFSFAVFGAALGCCTLLLRLPPDPGRKDATGERSLGLLRRRRLIGALLLMGGYVLPFGAFQAVLPLQLTDDGLDPLTIGLVFTVLALPIVVAAPLGGRSADRFGALPVAVAGMVAVSLAVATLGIFEGTVLLLFVIGFVGTADGFGITAGQAVVSGSVPEERQAAALGLMGATEVLVAGLVAIPSAVIYTEAGKTTLWALTAAATLAVVLLGAAIVGRPRYVPTERRAA